MLYDFVMLTKISWFGLKSAYFQVFNWLSSNKLQTFQDFFSIEIAAIWALVDEKWIPSY